MGGRKVQLNEIARTMWIFAKDRNIWLISTHIAGIMNVEADYLSRKCHRNTEWQLNKSLFQKLT